MVNDPVNRLSNLFFRHRLGPVWWALIHHDDLPAPKWRGANCLKNFHDRVGGIVMLSKLQRYRSTPGRLLTEKRRAWNKKAQSSNSNQD